MRRVLTAAIMISSLVLGLAASPLVMALVQLAMPTALGAFIALNVPHIIILALIAILCPLLLKRTLASMLWDSRMRKGLLAYAFLITFALTTILSLAQGDLHYNSAPASQRIPLFLAALLIVPLQCLSEEALCRALPARIFMPDNLNGQLRLVVPSALVSGLLFLALHGANSEWDVVDSPLLLALYYFGFGALSSLGGSLLGGYEAAWGMHSAINLSNALIVTYPSSPYAAASLLTTTSITPMWAMLLEMVLIHAMVTLPPLRRSNTGIRKSVWERNRKRSMCSDDSSY